MGARNHRCQPRYRWDEKTPTVILSRLTHTLTRGTLTCDEKNPDPTHSPPAPLLQTKAHTICKLSEGCYRGQSLQNIKSCNFESRRVVPCEKVSFPETIEATNFFQVTFSACVDSAVLRERIVQSSVVDIKIVLIFQFSFFLYFIKFVPY